MERGERVKVTCVQGIVGIVRGLGDEDDVLVAACAVLELVLGNAGVLGG
jgi:hypothetical protein